MNHRLTDPAARKAHDDFTKVLRLLERAQRSVEKILGSYCEDYMECDSWRHVNIAVRKFAADRESIVDLLEESESIEARMLFDSSLNCAEDR